MRNLQEVLERIRNKDRNGIRLQIRDIQIY